MKRPLPPWVKRLDTAVTCEGHVSSRASVRRMYSDDLEERAENARRVACKNLGRYRFTALPRRANDAWAADSGVYCWWHLVYHCLYGTPREEARTDRWAEKDRVTETDTSQS